MSFEARALFGGLLDGGRLPGSNVTQALTAKSSGMPPHALIFGKRGAEAPSRHSEGVATRNRVAALSTLWCTALPLCLHHSGFHPARVTIYRTWRGYLARKRASSLSPQFAPEVFLSAFSWDGQPPRLAEAVNSLPHGSKVVAHIGSMQFEGRNGLRLRYRILPDQPSWRETRSLDVTLGELSSGPHTLEVQGRIFTGPWSKTVSRSFAVLRPIWLTWPFLAGYLLLAASLATGGYLLRRTRQANKVELLPNLAAWRLGVLLPEVHRLAGTLLDSRFEVGALLARGGFANVMEGYDRDQKQRCAIKVFRAEVKEKAWIQRGFEHEVAALQKVRHPNVVPIYAHGLAPSGAPYLVMEFVDGKTLREVLEDGALTPRRTANLLRQLASALDAIHVHGICHRDVKPENVIIRNEGSRQEQAVLIDFSIAIVKDADETLYGLSRAAGSFDYMGPEQAIGYAEPSSDIYSLAKLVIELLTGRQLKYLLPHAALDLPDRVRDLARGLAIGLSDDAIAMLASALEFDPARRPRVAGAFAVPLISDLESDAGMAGKG
jgi:tRNA A-37 threonylcarbamoyl transferase component Bud32